MMTHISWSSDRPELQQLPAAMMEDWAFWVLDCHWNLAHYFDDSGTGDSTHTV